MKSTRRGAEGFDILNLSTKYRSRSLNSEDAEEILALYRSNPLYFQHCPPAPSEQSVMRDLTAVPEGWAGSKKHYLGFFEGSHLMAVLDLIEDFPHEDTVWIGLFMLDAGYSGHGSGTALISDILIHLAGLGYRRVGLGYVRTNMQAKRFWEKNGFLPSVSVEEGEGEIQILEKDLEGLCFKEEGEDRGRRSADG